MLDANQDYILSYLINIKTMKPFIRIYRRKSGIFSSVYIDMPLFSEFLDTGLFFKFITASQNFFVLKTSHEFRIYSIEPKYLTINLQGQSPATISGNPLLKELRLNLTLIARNQTKHSLVNSFDVLILAKEN
jgi:hypothetical protein